MNKIKLLLSTLIPMLIVGGVVFAQDLGLRTLVVPQGGTGAVSFTAGECLVGNGTGALTTQACGGGSSQTWQDTGFAVTAITPTTTSAGIWVTGSSTIDSTLNVNGITYFGSTVGIGDRGPNAQLDIVSTDAVDLLRIDDKTSN